ncbi:hypothetical protein BE21_43825 [Sorangium cellulosum]|uniref:Uncharacterized protein n=1 Tax=Sorangium cellulosum TaxID=56 RepID=A0A150TJW3_SORCE|nr:hypothetical protein BE21_43825 [Sorangium cellulosum]
MSAAARRLAPVDFGAGVQPVVQWFKSVALLVALDRSGDDFLVPADVIAGWVERYDAWYRRVTGIHEGRRLYLAYHRELSIVGHVPIDHPALLARIGLACRRAGMSFSVTVDVMNALKHREAFEQLLDTGLLGSIGINFPDGSERPSDSAARAMIEGWLTRDVHIGLIGPVSYYRSLGLLASSALNAASITLHPRSCEATHAGLRPERPIEACFGRLRLFIDTDGFIYPCVGLLGARAARLGSVHEDIEETVLGGRPTVLDLTTLARVGPSGASGAALLGAGRSSRRAPPCERHRAEMLEASSTAAVDEPEA